MPLDLKNLRREIVKNLRVLKREGTVVHIGSDKKWSACVKNGRLRRSEGFPFVTVKTTRKGSELPHVEEGTSCLPPKRPLFTVLHPQAKIVAWLTRELEKPSRRRL